MTPLIDAYPPIVGRIYPISEYIPNISNTRIYPIPIYIYIPLFIYSPIVGSIYPIQIHEIQTAAKKNSGAQFAAEGPNLPGPDLPGPNLPGLGVGGTPFLVLNEYFFELNPRKNPLLNNIFELNIFRNPKMNKFLN